MKPKPILLKGKNIVITRSTAGSPLWQKYFESLGAKVHAFPTIKIVPVRLDKKITAILEHIDDFDWVIVTSMEGLRAMNTLAKASGIKVSPKRIKALAVMGEGSWIAARAMGYRNIFRPSVATTTALAWEITLKKGASVLFLRSTIASQSVPKILTARGAQVTDIPVYRTMPVKDVDEHFLQLLKNDAIDFITFASPSAVRGFFARVDRKDQKGAKRIPTVAIGPSVAMTLKKYGFTHIRIALTPTIKGMAEAMI